MGKRTLPSNCYYTPTVDEKEGILVCVMKEGKTYNKTFSFKKHGSESRALLEAVQYKRQLKEQLYGCSNFNTKDRGFGGRVGKSKSNTGIVGVSECQNELKRKDGSVTLHFSFRVTWRENGVSKNKTFGFGNLRNKTTRKEALKQAINHRAKMEKLHYIERE